MKSKYEKDLARLQKKGTDHCTLCGEHFEDHEMVYTVFGYNRLGKLHVTSGCCVDRIAHIRLIGLCGVFDPDNFDEYLRNHPLYDTFMKKQANIKP